MISKTLAQIAATQTSIPWMTCFGLLIFVTFFIAMLFWTSRRERAPLYQAMSQMPFANETTEPVHSEVKL